MGGMAQLVGVGAQRPRAAEFSFLPYLQDGEILRLETPKSDNTVSVSVPFLTSLLSTLVCNY